MDRCGGGGSGGSTEVERPGEREFEAERNTQRRKGVGMRR